MQGEEVKGGKKYRQFSEQEQAQYLTDRHPAAARYTHLLHHLWVPQLLLFRLSPPTPPLAS